ncbi:hypothetical protein HMPREF9296_0300 [Prevotella disiens FB035-09AN]|uniref:Uncharacterized protein n=1 Tax=Prevotella disiens FB035-09AN TaxID=866771 RepID=E1KMQ3_9BACT|nr:hypothetical protein HMPREF9296_0300 [Prevotella disiens FB035-09AN]
MHLKRACFAMKNNSFLNLHAELHFFGMVRMIERKLPMLNVLSVC